MSAGFEPAGPSSPLPATLAKGGSNPKVPVGTTTKYALLPSTSSEPPGNRTPNLLIKSQLLCQLS